jgi:hypothetical protein
MTSTLVCADVLEWAETYAGAPFHAMLLDPPYHLSEPGYKLPGGSRPGLPGPRTEAQKAYRRAMTKGFMGQSWDGGDIAFRPETWVALARHLLPGAFVMAFASSRGWHRLACAMEDAGLILHPSIFGWANGQSFPKATRIDTQVDAAAGAEREVMEKWDSRSAYDGYSRHGSSVNAYWSRLEFGEKSPTAPSTTLAQTWAGHRYGGQMLKNALEPIIVAQVPYLGRPVDSITATGAGALCIEGGRIKTSDTVGASGRWGFTTANGWNNNNIASRTTEQYEHSQGRWPPNLAICHLSSCKPLAAKTVPGTNIPGPGARAVGYSGCEGPSASIQNYAAPDGTETVQAYACSDGCPVAALDLQAGERSSGKIDAHHKRNGSASWFAGDAMYGSYGDSGAASRFFFTADWALDVAEQLAQADPVYYCAKASASERHQGLEGRNTHCTVKPLTLLRWLATLLLPPAAYAPRRLLVPFAGTSSEMIGGILAGWETVLGIERDATYVEIGRQRLAWWTGQTPETVVPAEKVLEAAPPGTQAQLSLF